MPVYILHTQRLFTELSSFSFGVNGFPPPFFSVSVVIILMPQIKVEHAEVFQ